MIGRLFKRDAEPSLVPASPVPTRAPGREPTRAATTAGKPVSEPVSFDAIGPTLVATILTREVTAERVADLSYRLRDYLEHRDNIKNVVVDLHNVQYLDSACLNMLIHLLKAVQQAGGRIALAAPTHCIEVLFKLTRLDRLFVVHKDVLGAIAALERKAGGRT